MKVALVFLSLFALTFSIPTKNENKILSPMILFENKDIPLELPQEFFEQLAKNLEKGNVLEATLNDYADKVFINIDKLLVNMGLDPYALPDMKEGFNYLLTSGELSLTNGNLTDLSTMYRGGDVDVTYDPNGKNILKVVIPIAFKDLSFVYKYKAQFMNLGPIGNLNGKISKLKVQIAVSFDFNKYQAVLNKFAITNSGHISLTFSGNALTDWILNLFINAATSIMKQVIIIIMNAIIKNPVQSIIDTINAVLSGILNPTTVSSLLV